MDFELSCVDIGRYFGGICMLGRVVKLPRSKLLHQHSHLSTPGPPCGRYQCSHACVCWCGFTLVSALLFCLTALESRPCYYILVFKQHSAETAHRQRHFEGTSISPSFTPVIKANSPSPPSISNPAVVSKLRAPHSFHAPSRRFVESYPSWNLSSQS